MNFSFHKTETTDAHLSSPSAKVFPFIEFLGDKSYCLFVWSRVRAEKTEEDTLGSEVATTSPSAKVFPFIEFLGDKSYCLFGLGFRLKKQKKTP